MIGARRRIIARPKPVAPVTPGEYDPAAVAYFAAMTSQPSTTRKNRINELILALKAAGVWATYDLLYIGASHDLQAALINVKSPGSYNLQIVGATYFLADRYIETRVGGGYFNTGFNLNDIPSANRNLKSNSVSAASMTFGLWSLLSATSTSSSVGAYQDAGNGGYTLAPLSDGTNASIRVQSVGGGALYAGGNSLGLYNARRFQSDNVSLKKNKGAPAVGLMSMGPVPNQPFRFGNIQGAAGMAMKAAFGFVGGFKTDAQCDAEYDAFAAYLTAIGAL